MFYLSDHLTQFLLRLLKSMLQLRVLLIILIEGHNLGRHFILDLLVLPLQLCNLVFGFCGGRLERL